MPTIKITGTHPVHVFPERSVVDAISEGKLLETITVLSQSVHHKVMKRLRISQRFLGLDWFPVLTDVGSIVVKEKSGVYSATAIDRLMLMMITKEIVQLHSLRLNWLNKHNIHI